MNRTCRFSRGASLVAAALALVAMSAGLDVSAQNAPKARLAEAPKNAKELFDAFRAVPGVRATYRESKKLSVLDDEILSEGIILFAPPIQLVRVTTKPIWSSMVLREKSIVIRDASGTQKMPASKGSPARAFVQVFVDVARGDQAALALYFQISFKTTATGWAVSLSPKDKKKLPITSITLVGRGTDLESMTLIDGLGDRTSMSFTSVDISRRPTSKEIETLLREP